MSDLISRQEAIEAMCSACGYDCDKSEFIYDAPQNEQMIICPEHYALTQLPAQPEIIRCKECKHHWTHRCMDSMPTEICELGQTFYDANVDFCSLAERRTDE